MWMFLLIGLLDFVVLVLGIGWGGGEKEDVYGLFLGIYEFIEFFKEYVNLICDFLIFGVRKKNKVFWIKVYVLFFWYIKILI